MKKTAVLLYDTCCLFELTVALEMLKMAEKPVVYFAKELKPIRTEEGMLVIADNTFEQLNVDEYDSLLITGATDAQGMVEDESSQEFVSKFYDAGTLIGAISIAPILLLKLGYLKEKPFMIGVEKSDLYEEGFTDDDMKYMIGWEESCDEVVPEKYLKTDNIITSVAFGFRQWAMAIGKELNIELYPKSFDL
ncbi:Putative intracellular protease/amidase [Proteiniborus ethanoligenes]|uniref:Putative intracellular protease/amidase n=1 Tax=Proteiniborus ethanoligenes TaxID=415015 RepID=A0A1H3PEK6_9FIRM|nr:DJ-1/PfpI family protein [Proteiniborus ethanoligenes]SDY99584.1 Putative intracellular protease/amidase [Proteiniborus ethanoligenes]